MLSESDEPDGCEQEREGMLQSPIIQFALFVLLFAAIFIGGLQFFGS